MHALRRLVRHNLRREQDLLPALASEFRQRFRQTLGADIKRLQRMLVRECLCSAGQHERADDRAEQIHGYRPKMRHRLTPKICVSWTRVQEVRRSVLRKPNASLVEAGQRRKSSTIFFGSSSRTSTGK